MKLLTSDRLELPKVYFVSDREKIEEIPPGVPFIYGDEFDEPYIVRLLEYEVLYQEAVRSGYPFNFRKILKENGYNDIREFDYHNPAYLQLTTKGDPTGVTDVDEKKWELGTSAGQSKFKEFVKDSSCYVDIEKLKALNVFPVWLNTIEDAVSTNIHNFAVFNNNMYNKKLEGMFGSLDLVSPSRNLIIIDISGSIPRAVSSTTLTLAKNLAETFYADLLITGSKSTLYAYENLHELNIDTIYDENGMDNDQVYFKKLVTSTEKRYKTAIVFGDNHNPGWDWSNKYNRNTKTISEKDGKKMCKWEIEKLISFHTSDYYTQKNKIAGYAVWFEPEEIERIEGWVEYLK
jgi:hypothetical protein